MYSYPYSYASAYTYTPFFSIVLPVLALIVILAGGLALYFLFVRKPNTFQGAAAKLHDALTFRTFYTEKLLRALQPDEHRRRRLGQAQPARALADKIRRAYI